MIHIRNLGSVDYESTLASMIEFTDHRSPDTPDEIWLLEHAPVFTLGLAAEHSHVLAPGDIPVVQVDRGGQVTYHGPGQLVAYTLIDLKRAGLTIRDLVSALENAIIETVAGYGIEARNRGDAPGVYVGEAKLQLPWPGAEYRYGSRAVRQDQPVRLRRPANDAIGLAGWPP